MIIIMYMYSIIVSKLLCLVYEEGVLTNSARYYNKNQTEKRERERKKGDNRGGDGQQVLFFGDKTSDKTRSSFEKDIEAALFSLDSDSFFFLLFLLIMCCESLFVRVVFPFSSLTFIIKIYIPHKLSPYILSGFFSLSLLLCFSIVSFLFLFDLRCGTHVYLARQTA
jgi:hypothetical protein